MHFCTSCLSCVTWILSWWRHQIETFSALLALCGGNSPVTGEFPSQRPVTRSFDGFFDLRLNKRISKQLKRRWFEMPSRSLWCYCNVSISFYSVLPQQLRLGHSPKNILTNLPTTFNLPHLRHAFSALTEIRITVYLKNHVICLRFVVFCFGFYRSYLSDIIQNYFTDAGTISDKLN